MLRHHFDPDEEREFLAMEPYLEDYLAYCRLTSFAQQVPEAYGIWREALDTLDSSKETSNE